MTKVYKIESFYIRVEPEMGWMPRGNPEELLKKERRVDTNGRRPLAIITAGAAMRTN